MTAQPQAESWCMEINFRPQHSKWLQRSISDVNLKLKDISRLVEEDADSFASRAEMYFQNRPQLMNLVKELYQAYHALAEQYNDATRALHQTHLTVFKALPSKSDAQQIPDMPILDTSDELQKDTTLVSISDMDAKLKATIELLEEDAGSFAKRAEMYYKHRPRLVKLVEEFYREYRALAEQYDTMAKVLREALHTISDAFLKEIRPAVNDPNVSDSPTSSQPYSEHDELGDGDNNSLNNLAVKRSATYPEEKWLRTLDESSQLTKEIESLKERLSSETKRANKAEGQVATLSASIKHLSIGKDAAETECQAYIQKLAKVEAELLKAHSEMKELADGWAREVGNLQSTEKIKQSQKQELEDLKEKLREQEARQFESERNISKQKEEEDALKISELMEAVELSKIETETIVWELKKEIVRLNEQNYSSEILISELEHKNSMLRDTKERLETELDILRERLWIYFGKQEKMLFTAASSADAGMPSTSSKSSNLLDLFSSRLDHVLRPLRSSIGTFFFSLGKAVVYVYTNFFPPQNSEKIIKEDDQCKIRLLLDVEKLEKNEMPEQELCELKCEMDELPEQESHELRGEIDNDQMISQEKDCKEQTVSETVTEGYREET